MLLVSEKANSLLTGYAALKVLTYSVSYPSILHRQP